METSRQLSGRRAVSNIRMYPRHNVALPFLAAINFRPLESVMLSSICRRPKDIRTETLTNKKKEQRTNGRHTHEQTHRQTYIQRHRQTY